MPQKGQIPPARDCNDDPIEFLTALAGGVKEG